METITIDGEEFEVDDVSDSGYLPTLSIGNRDYFIAESPESAGKVSAQHWRDSQMGVGAERRAGQRIRQ